MKTYNPDNLSLSERVAKVVVERMLSHSSTRPSTILSRRLNGSTACRTTPQFATGSKLSRRRTYYMDTNLAAAIARLCDVARFVRSNPEWSQVAIVLASFMKPTKTGYIPC